MPVASRIPSRLGPSLIAVWGGLWLFITWYRWPDILIDFGRELYVPWRLLEGEVLYRDLLYLNGPFSPYFNALAFSVGGVSLDTLVVVNLGWLVLGVRTLYRILVRLWDRFTATVAMLLLVPLFFLGAVTPAGNYNFLCPYSHEAVHGLVLSLLSMRALLTRPARRSAPFVAGLLGGLVFLTKAEIFLALVVALLVGVGGFGDWGRTLVRLVGGMVVPPVVALALLLPAMPAPLAVFGTMGTWHGILTSDVGSLYFYRFMMGTWEPGISLRLLASAGVWWLVLLGGLIVASRLGAGVVVAFGGLAAAGLALFVSDTGWFQAARPLPLMSLLLFGWEWRRRPPSPHRWGRLAFMAFAGAMLIKIVLFARIYHYGFVLALPASALAVAALVGDLPRSRQATRGGEAATRVAAVILVVGIGYGFCAVSIPELVERTHPVGPPGDRFWASSRGRTVSRAVELIRRRVAPGQTLLVAPDGVILNYLARRANGIGVLNLMPPEFLIQGEQEVARRAASHPPDWVAIVPTNSEYDYRMTFGDGFGRRLVEWIDENYAEVLVVGDGADAGFAIRLLKRRVSRQPDV